MRKGRQAEEEESFLLHVVKVRLLYEDYYNYK